jgi:hypothetical protein
METCEGRVGFTSGSDAIVSGVRVMKTWLALGMPSDLGICLPTIVNWPISFPVSELRRPRH